MVTLYLAVYLLVVCRMMLTYVDGAAPSFEERGILDQLPMETLQNVFSFLPWSSIANAVCFTSAKFFYAATDLRVWPDVDMSDWPRSVEDVMALRQRASETCVKLTMPRMRHENDDRKGLSLLYDASYNGCKWPKVQRLVIDSIMAPTLDEDDCRFTAGLRRDVFPSIKSLRFVPIPGGGPRVECMLRGLDLPHVTALEILADSFGLILSGGQEFFPGYANMTSGGTILCFKQLESLVLYSCKLSFLMSCYLSQFFVSLRLPRLRSLKLVACKFHDLNVLHRYNLSTNYRQDDVERICICIRSVEERRPDLRNYFEDVELFFGRHPRLTTLLFPLNAPLADFSWDNVDRPRLEQLEELRVSVKHVDGSSAEVLMPFEHMKSLRVAHVRLASSGAAAVRGLLSLLKLEYLKLEEVELKMLAEHLPASPSRVRYLDLQAAAGEEVNPNSELHLSYLRQVMDAMPLLEVIKVDCQLGESCAPLTSLLAREGSKLRQFWVRRVQESPEGPGCVKDEFGGGDGELSGELLPNM